jgi:hypothetical protein
MQSGFEGRGRLHFSVICVAVGLIATAVMATDAQIRYSKGQDVAPTFEGWEPNPDGTFSMYFGYLNRNAAEGLHVPLGPDNNFDMGNGDQGQPTYFHPGRKWWVFKVVVPGDWPKDKRLVWTLTSRGRTSQAKGWLQAEWEVDKPLIAGNAGRDPFLGGVSGGNEEDIVANKAPSLTGSNPQTITLPNTATVSVTATDDGLPRPTPDPTGRRQQGVRVRWFVYRGPGLVRFDPEITPTAIHGKPVVAEAKATFTMPGEYRLRAIALDGRQFSTFDVDVTVKAANVSQGAR